MSSNTTETALDAVNHRGGLCCVYGNGSGGQIEHVCAYGLGAGPNPRAHGGPATGPNGYPQSNTSAGADAHVKPITRSHAYSSDSTFANRDTGAYSKTNGRSGTHCPTCSPGDPNAGTLPDTGSGARLTARGCIGGGR